MMAHQITIDIKPGEWPNGMTVVAIDPGGTSGVAVAGFTKDILYVETVSIGWVDEVKEFERLFNMMKGQKRNHIVVEDFRLRADKAPSLAWNQMVAAKVIGFVEGICKLYELSDPRFIQPAQTKAITREHLIQRYKSLPHDRHQLDALRILAQFIIKYQQGDVK
jgi:hypothetical protein